MYDLALTELAPMLFVLGLTKATFERDKARGTESPLFPLDGFRCVCVHTHGGS